MELLNSIFACYNKFKLVPQEKSADVICEMIGESKTTESSGILVTQGIHPVLGRSIVVSYGAEVTLLGTCSNDSN